VASRELGRQQQVSWGRRDSFCLLWQGNVQRVEVWYRDFEMRSFGFNFSNVLDRAEEHASVFECF
jgi:hypothetical protein